MQLAMHSSAAMLKLVQFNWQPTVVHSLVHDAFDVGTILSAFSTDTSYANNTSLTRQIMLYQIPIIDYPSCHAVPQLPTQGCDTRAGKGRTKKNPQPFT